MKKRQRKKIQKKAEREMVAYFESLRPMIEESNRRLEQMCKYRGHDYILVDWPDYKGYICKCCGDKIERKAADKIAVIGSNASAAGRTLARLLHSHGIMVVRPCNKALQTTSNRRQDLS